MNGFDDFDTKVAAEEFYRGEGYDTDTIDEFVKRDAEAFYADVLVQAEYHETHKPKPAPWKGKVLESLMGGQYHGPSNEAGLTAREYWEMMDEYRDEQSRLRDEW